MEGISAAAESHVEWREVAGFPNYSISSDGEVKSLAFNKPRLLKFNVNQRGVRQVRLGKHQPWKSVHILVAETFIGPRPEGMVICHNNGDVTDNRVKNLRYDTQSNNIIDSVNHGTHHYSSRTHCKNNHEYTVSNTHYYKGARVCRECKRDYYRRSK